MPRLIDLSIAIENDVPADPAFQRSTVTDIDHAASAPTVAGLFPGLTPADLPDGLGGRERAALRP